MGLFDKLKEPVFLKENSNADEQLEKLKEIESLLNKEGQAILRQDIKYLEYGIAGEKNIAFELKNSHMPMYVLHDVYLTDGDLSAQIDYLVFTRKICFVIECKNLYGDIEINNAGEFIRTLEYNGKRKKEGIYSPITQNQRHLDLIRKKVITSSKNFISKLVNEKSFDDTFKSLVVLSNPKMLLNDRYAKKEVKAKVIRADQLVTTIKQMYNESNMIESSDSALLGQAQSFVVAHRDITKDYIDKYNKYMLSNNSETVINAEKLLEEIVVNEKETDKYKHTDSIIEENNVLKENNTMEQNYILNENNQLKDNIYTEDNKIIEEQLRNKLKEYRLRISREEKIKPYFLFNDAQLNDLISKSPINKEQLLNVHGFGEVKVKKYGDDIITIIVSSKFLLI